jgi:hypothetical protein
MPVLTPSWRFYSGFYSGPVKPNEKVYLKFIHMLALCKWMVFAKARFLFAK